MAQVNDLNMRLDISSGHLEKARETNMALESTILAERASSAAKDGTIAALKDNLNKWELHSGAILRECSGTGRGSGQSSSSQIPPHTPTAPDMAHSQFPTMNPVMMPSMLPGYMPNMMPAVQQQQQQMQMQQMQMQMQQMQQKMNMSASGPQ